VSATGKGPFRLQLPLLSSVTALSTADKGQLGLPRGAFPVLEHGLGLGAISTEFQVLAGPWPVGPRPHVLAGAHPQAPRRFAQTRSDDLGGVAC
jgi:hypothetical protein